MDHTGEFSQAENGGPLSPDARGRTPDIISRTRTVLLWLAGPRDRVKWWAVSHHFQELALSRLRRHQEAHLPSKCVMRRRRTIYANGRECEGWLIGNATAERLAFSREVPSAARASSGATT